MRRLRLGCGMWRYGMMTIAAEGLIIISTTAKTDPVDGNMGQASSVYVGFIARL